MAIIRPALLPHRRPRAMPDLLVTIETLVVVPGRVAASFAYTGTQIAAYLGVAPTGRRLLFTSCDIFTVTGGQFSEHWGMGDIAGVMAQLEGPVTTSGHCVAWISRYSSSNNNMIEGAYMPVRVRTIDNGSQLDVYLCRLRYRLTVIQPSSAL